MAGCSRTVAARDYKEDYKDDHKEDYKEDFRVIPPPTTLGFTLLPAAAEDNGGPCGALFGLRRLLFHVICCDVGFARSGHIVLWKKEGTAAFSGRPPPYSEGVQ